MSDVIITCICGKHQIDIKKDQDLFNFLEQSNLIEGVTDATSIIQALEAWSYLEEQEELTSGVILKLHKILMLHQHLMPNEKGYFRTIQVQVGGREGIRWEKIPLEIEEWCKDAMTSVEVPGEDGKHIKIDHVSYEKIHPFVDGNGRTGRMLMNWQRLKAGLPLLIIWDKYKRAYYDWFV